MSKARDSLRSSLVPVSKVRTAYADDAVAQMRAVMAQVAAGTTREVNDVLRTADELSTTWNRLASNTQKVFALSDERAARRLTRT